MVKVYNKLVRDRIPEIIKENGGTCVTQVLSNSEYLNMIDAKLDEEIAEYHADQNLEELADILELVYAAAAARGCSATELDQIRAAKAAKNGAFIDRIFLIEVDQP